MRGGERRGRGRKGEHGFAESKGLWPGQQGPKVVLHGQHPISFGTSMPSLTHLRASDYWLHWSSTSPPPSSSPIPSKALPPPPPRSLSPRHSEMYLQRKRGITVETASANPANGPRRTTRLVGTPRKRLSALPDTARPLSFRSSDSVSEGIVRGTGNWRGPSVRARSRAQRSRNSCVGYHRGIKKKNRLFIMTPAIVKKGLSRVLRKDV